MPAVDGLVRDASGHMTHTSDSPSFAALPERTQNERDGLINADARADRRRSGSHRGAGGHSPGPSHWLQGATQPDAVPSQGQ